MKRITAYITFLDILFLLLLSISGGISGILSDAVYYLAFLIPIFFGIYLIKEHEKSDAENQVTLGFGINKKSAANFIPLVFPIITAILAVSLLTSLLMGIFGFTDSTEISEPFPAALMLHALLPAILEEMLFRYIPLKLTLGYSRRWGIIISSLFFSLSHANIFRLPYAFIAGILFALVDIMADSILPSVILHFINNALSLVFIIYLDESATLPFFLIMLSLAVISAVFIFIKRQNYKKFFKPILEGGKKTELSLAPIALIAVTLILAITDLFQK